MKRDDLIEALWEKIGHLQRMQAHLSHSQKKVARMMPLPNLSQMTEDELESLAAMKGRFSEMQDHLAAAMKLIARIEEENTETFTYVLQFMVKNYVLESAEEWLHARDVRNAAAHDYSEDEDEQVVFYQTLFQLIPYLFDVRENIEKKVTLLYPRKAKL